MNIFYEDSILYAESFFPSLGNCQSFSGRQLDPASLADADILLVRSTTKVNRELIAHCPKLQFVASATAGFNHIDGDSLDERHIPWQASPGCNAESVAEYVISCLAVMAMRRDWILADKTVGIVGAGMTGSALSRKLDALGVTYLLCDPPKQQAGDPRPMVDMDAIMQCDIISLHVPLIEQGAHPTYHLFDHKRLEALTEQQLLINACRGEVVDNDALLEAFRHGRDLSVILDVWEGEPNINLALLPYVQLASAHIAGHSLEGKARGTEMVYQALCHHLNRPAPITLQQILPVPEQPVIDMGNTVLQWSDLYRLIRQVYDVEQDDRQFRQQVGQPGQFEYIRKNYAIRREFAAITVKAGKSPLSEAIYRLGFATP